MLEFKVVRAFFIKNQRPRDGVSPGSTSICIERCIQGALDASPLTLHCLFRTSRRQENKKPLKIRSVV